MYNAHTIPHLHKRFILSYFYAKMFVPFPGALPAARERGTPEEEEEQEGMGDRGR